jgi:hypothetical protein
VAAGSLREPARVSQMLMVLVLGYRPPTRSDEQVVGRAGDGRAAQDRGGARMTNDLPSRSSQRNPCAALVSLSRPAAKHSASAWSVQAPHRCHLSAALIRAEAPYTAPYIVRHHRTAFAHHYLPVEKRRRYGEASP